MPLKTPVEDYAKETIKVAKDTAKMQKDLNKFGHKTGCGGTVWTVGDMQRYFSHVDKKKKKK
jgi:hypothetical protein